MDPGTILGIVCGACIGLAFVLCLIKECRNNTQEPEVSLQQTPDLEAEQIEGQPYQAAPLEQPQNAAAHNDDDNGQCCAAVCLTCMLFDGCDI